jgi:uncharacterized protein (DUF1697 family)
MTGRSRVWATGFGRERSRGCVWATSYSSGPVSQSPNHSPKRWVFNRALVPAGALMPVHVALLRAVNVAGQRPVPMARLGSLFEKLGFTNVRTLLQSGNVVFDGGTRTGVALEHFLESSLTRHLGLETKVMVRTRADWSRLLVHNPFPSEGENDPGHLVVMFLKGAPTAGAVADLQAAIRGPERVQAFGTHAYIVYPDGIGTSRLANAVIERKLGYPATGRNWNTVRKLGALVSG